MARLIRITANPAFPTPLAPDEAHRPEACAFCGVRPVRYRTFCSHTCAANATSAALARTAWAGPAITAPLSGAAFS